MSDSFDSWIVSAKYDVLRLRHKMRQQQAELFQTAAKLVALHQEATERAPKEITSRRSKRFLKVIPTDPAVAALYQNGDPPGSFNYEVFKALEAEKLGRIRIVPGQDLDPGEVEITYTPAGIPDELKSIKHICVDPLVHGAIKRHRKESDFEVISRFLFETNIKIDKREVTG